MFNKSKLVTVGLLLPPFRNLSGLPINNMHPFPMCRNNFWRMYALSASRRVIPFSLWFLLIR